MSENLITDAEMFDAPDWAWDLSHAIVLGNQGAGNAAVLIHRAFTAQLTEATNTERAAVVAWLRGLNWTHMHHNQAQFFAAAIERGDHVRTDPSTKV